MGFIGLDIVLGVLLIGYLISGLRWGFARSVGGILGLVAGGIAAFFVVPLASGYIAEALWRTVGSVAIAVVLLVLGHAAGSAIGRAIAGTLRATPLSIIDRLLGGAANVVLTALVLSLISTSVATLGIPFVSQALGQSVVLSTIDRATPEPVQRFLAQVRSIAVQDAIPGIVDALGGITETPAVPGLDTQTEALATASESVVRITGNASACAQSQSGTGFVIAEDRVVTNAHVVAGVTEPVVEALDGEVATGRVVYFDPIDDLAVIAVGDFSVAALPVSPTLPVGAEAVFQGYPFGGPFSSGPASVLAVTTENVEDVYGDSANPREVYTLAADVQPGNSGGPLLTTDGSVAGVIFAKSAATANVGYAMTLAELQPVADQAASLDEAVASGSCASS